MAYGTKYSAEFDSVSENRYSIDLLKKDYTGDVLIMVLAGVPVKHQWQTDDPMAPIKGSSLILNILNPGGNDVMTDYDEIVQLFFVADPFPSFLTLAGLFVPEVGIPFTVSGHSDPLANQTFTPTSIINAGINLYQVYVADGEITADTAGDFAIITGISSSGNLPITTFFSNEDDTWKCKFYENNNLKFEGFLVQDDCNEILVDYIHEISLSFNDNLGLLKDVVLYQGEPVGDHNERIPLLDIISYCIQQTGLELETFVYANIFETTFTTDNSFLAQAIIDTQTFVKGDGFDNCYNILTSILDRFHLSLIQSNGAWHIVRWAEIRYTAGAIPYYRYDSTFSLIGTGTLDKNFITGFEQSIYPENGLSRSIFRPFQYDKETFNYVQPKYLLRNYDMQDLGPLIRTYSDGPNTISEYEFTDWTGGGFVPQPDFFIRVVTDSTGTELQRYVVITGATGDTARAISGTPFEVDAGGKIKVTFRFITPFNSQPGSGTVVLALRLFDGTTTNYADEDPTVNWKPSLGWNYEFPAGSNTNQDQSVTIDPGRIPYTGLMFVYLPQAVGGAGTGDETQIRDIRVEYSPYINDSTKIIGHVHKSEQDAVIKNNEATDIYVDDTPSNAIIGTLFLESLTGLVQDRTTKWYRLSNPSELLKVGNITTLEQEQWRQIPRTKLEGTFYGVENISMLAILSNVGLPDLNFVFGSLEIDYKNNNFNSTMWELYTNGEEDITRLEIDYSFNYLYAKE